MTSLFQYRIVAVVLLWTSGCGPSLEFEHPLVDPTLAPVCPELFGIYPLDGDEDERETFLYISSAGEGFPQGFLKMKFLVSTADGRVEILDGAVLGFCAKHMDDYFFHLPMKEEVPAGDDDDRFFQDDWSASETVAYDINIWAFDHDTSSFEWTMFNSEYLAEQIEAGHLRGTLDYDDEQAGEGQLQSVHVTATEEELRRFIRFVKDHNSDALSESALGQFKKLQFSGIAE